MIILIYKKLESGNRSEHGAADTLYHGKLHMLCMLFWQVFFSKAPGWQLNNKAHCCTEYWSFWLLGAAQSSVPRDDSTYRKAFSFPFCFCLLVCFLSQFRTSTNCCRSLGRSWPILTINSHLQPTIVSSINYIRHKVVLWPFLCHPF